MFYRQMLLLLGIFVVGCGLSHEERLRRDDYLRRAQIYYKKGKFFNALHQIEQALNIDPEYSRALISKGWTLHYMKKYKAAEEVFAKALKIDDSNPWLHHGLGSTSYKRGTLLEIKLIQLREQVEKNPQKKHLFAKEIEMHKKARDQWYIKSLEHYNWVLRLQPSNYRIYRLIAMNYAARGMRYYLPAINNLKKFITFVEQDIQSIKISIQVHKRKRLDPNLKEADKEVLDATVENLKSALKNAEKEYRIAEGAAGDYYFKLALLEKDRSSDTGLPLADRNQHKEKYLEYIQLATKSSKSILKTDPNMVNQYLNLKNIAKMQGNYKLVAKYIKEYLKRAPLADPKIRAKEIVELREIEAELKKKKDSQNKIH